MGVVLNQSGAGAVGEPLEPRPLWGMRNGSQRVSREPFLGM